MTFYVKYAGSTLVEELEDGESYGDRVCGNAVTTILNMVSLQRKQEGSCEGGSRGVCVSGVRR